MLSIDGKWRLVEGQKIVKMIKRRKAGVVKGRIYLEDWSRKLLPCGS